MGFVASALAAIVGVAGVLPYVQFAMDTEPMVLTAWVMCQVWVTSAGSL